MSNPLQLSLVNFKKGAYIIVEGKQKADHFYIIRSGKVTSNKQIEVVQEENGNILEAGDFFGVVSTMSSHSYIETAQALSDVSLISVHRDQYPLLIKRNTPVAMKIINSFSKRMRYLDESLTRLTFKNTADVGVEHLFDVAEYYVRQSQYNQAFYAYYKYIQGCPNGKKRAIARQRIQKIKPYANAVYLTTKSDEFTRNYPKETMIFSEGESGGELYIIQSGSVKITKIVNDNEVLLAVLKTGDIFGEMALLENKPRSASAIAHEDAVLLAVNKANFERMVSGQPQIIDRLTKLLAERIWLIYKQIANTMIKDPLGRMYDMLLIQLEKSKISTERSVSFTFDFGPKELINMVGLQYAEGKGIIRDLFRNTKLKVVSDQIHVTDITEVEKQAKYYQKMQRIEIARKEGSIRSY